MLGGPAGSAAGGTGCGEERERLGGRVMTRAAERPSSRGGGEPGLKPQMGWGGGELENIEGTQNTEHTLFSRKARNIPEGPET